MIFGTPAVLESVLHSFSVHGSYSDKGLERKCCYDNKGELTAGPLSGIRNRNKYPAPDVSIISLFWEDILPYIECCLLSDNCFKYQELGTSGSRYIPPSIGKFNLVLINKLVYRIARLKHPNLFI